MLQKSFILTFFHRFIVVNRIKAEIIHSWDLSIIVVLSLLLAPFLFSNSQSMILIMMGLPFIIFFPGYALVATVFPNKVSLDVAERIALSLGLSIGMVSIIGFILNYTSIGIRLESILSFIVLFDLILCFIALLRRIVSLEPFIPFSPHAFAISTKRALIGGKTNNAILTFVLTAAILSSAIAFVYVEIVPKDDNHFSEFYVLGPGGSAGNYPNNLTVGESGQVILGIANHEYRTVNYTVEVWLSNATSVENVTEIHHLLFVEDFSVVLNQVSPSVGDNWTKEWEDPFNFSVPQTGIYKIWFVLMLDATPFDGVKNQDYVNTPAESRFTSMIYSSSNYSLNLNLHITK